METEEEKKMQFQNNFDGFTSQPDYMPDLISSLESVFEPLGTPIKEFHQSGTQSP